MDGSGLTPKACEGVPRWQTKSLFGGEACNLFEPRSSRAIPPACTNIVRPTRAHQLRMVEISRYWFFSKVLLIDANDFCSEDADLSTATLRTIEPLKPVSPACSDPINMMR